MGVQSHWRIRRGRGRRRVSEDVACAKGDSEVEYVCEKLAPDETHRIAVKALNSNGDASDPGTAVACLGPCELVVSNVSTSGLLLSWTGLERYRAPQQSVLLHEARVLLGENELAMKSGSHRAYKTLSISSWRVRPPTWVRCGSTAARAAGTQGGWDDVYNAGGDAPASAETVVAKRHAQQYDLSDR